MNDKQEQIQEQIKEMECFNCIHATVCFAQKGGVNLQLVNNMGCDYYQPKLPEGSIVLSKEEWQEVLDDTVKNTEEKAELINEIEKTRKQAVKEFVNDIIDLVHNETFRKGYELEKVESRVREIAKNKYGVKL